MVDNYFTITQRNTDLGDGRQQVTVHLTGEFDLGARDQLRYVLLDVIEGGLPCAVVIDLAETTFLDSEALSAIIDGYLAAYQSGIAYRLANATGVVRPVLELVNVPDLL